MIDSTIQFNDSDTNEIIVKDYNRDITLQKNDGTTIVYQHDGTIVLFEPKEYTAYYYPNGSTSYRGIYGQLLEPTNLINNSKNVQVQNIREQYPFKDYDSAAKYFVAYSKSVLGDVSNRSIKIFTSDYTLYWFDYQGGCDVVLAHLGWNNSINQQIALARGAASFYNKSWGAMITWTYDKPPYLESGAEMYDQLVAAYVSGAKYEVVFNYPQITGNPYGVLTDDHFKALEKFWNNIQTLKVNKQAEAVLVLPQNYGWGMRRTNDAIWGLWDPDEKSKQIWDISEKLLNQFDSHLDIVFNDSKIFTQNQYTRIYYWNDTNLFSEKSG
jgi:hypothetical protein